MKPYDPIRQGITAEFGSAEIRDSFQSVVTNPDDAWSPLHLFLEPPATDFSHPIPTRYRLYGEIARGGMGIVFSARDTWLGRDVVIKLLRHEMLERKVSHTRFLREARIHGQLQHQCVVPIYDIGQSNDGRPFLTMKYIDGLSLQRLLSERPDHLNRLSEWVEVLIEVCRGIGYAHNLGVIHRDLKPQNIMRTLSGKVFVLDWGLATLIHDSSDACTDTLPLSGDSMPMALSAVAHLAGHTVFGSTVGTPGYMAPEQARGEQTDARADVFALGAILCEILTGIAPFAHVSPAETWRRNLTGDTTEAMERLRGSVVNRRLLGICARCLSKRREDRPQDANALAKELTVILDLLN
jgi:eukaryotic-like serine/threonine-protein kinase